MNRILSAGILSLCFVRPADAEPDFPPVQVRLDGPEVARLAWDTQSLAPADFDGDGRLDVAVLNNENGKLVLLYQRSPDSPEVVADRRPVSRDRWEPVMEDARFQKVSLPADQRHFALAAGDFDGDGRPDVAMTGATDALTVRFQGEKAAFSRSWTWRDFEPLPAPGTMAAADLNGDGRTDLAVLGKFRLLLFLQKPEGGFGTPVSFQTTEEKAGWLMAEDVDGDRDADLLYVALSGEGSLRLRRQTAPGQFPAEVAFDFPQPGFGVSAGRDAAGRFVLTRVNAKSRLIEQFRLVMDSPEAIQDDRLLPTLFSAPSGVKSAIYTSGDFDGDGLADIAQADPKVAQVALYFQQPDGTFSEPQTFPSLAGINGLAAIRPEAGRPHRLVVTSSREGVGVSSLSPEGRLEFPDLKPLDGSPAGVAALGAPDGTSVPVVIAESGRAWSLHFPQVAEGRPAVDPVPLKALKREPAGLTTGDLNGDGHDDLLVTVSKDPALVMLARPAGGLSEPLAETPAIRSQLTALSPDRVVITDIDGDRRAEILTASTGYARSIRLDGNGADVAIVDQFNARQAEDRLVAPVVCDTDGDGSPELLFQEAGSAWWQVLRRDEAGVYRLARRIQAAPMDATGAAAIPLGREARPHLVAFGQDRFWAAPLAGTRPALTLVASYETDLKDTKYFHAIRAPLHGAGPDLLAAFDSERNLLEILQPGGVSGDGWRSLLHFVLFEENLHFRGRKGQNSVREAIAGDFTGDGRTDLLLLVHDRLLLYPQAD